MIPSIGRFVPHAHFSILLFIENPIGNYSRAEYQDQSPSSFQKSSIAQFLNILFDLAYIHVQKPGCYNEIFEFFKSCPDTDITSPDQVAVVGDRLFTDVMMANLMGSWSVWVKDGVIKTDKTLVCSSVTNIDCFGC